MKLPSYVIVVGSTSGREDEAPSQLCNIASIDEISDIGWCALYRRSDANTYSRICIRHRSKEVAVGAYLHLTVIALDVSFPVYLDTYALQRIISGRHIFKGWVLPITPEVADDFIAQELLEQL